MHDVFLLVYIQTIWNQTKAMTCDRFPAKGTGRTGEHVFQGPRPGS